MEHQPTPTTPARVAALATQPLPTSPETTVSDASALPLLLRGAEVASLLNISRSQTYAMMRRGDLPTVHIGKAVRVPREAVTDWIRRHTRIAQIG
jgi:excisionase family DNA binding protein